MTTLTSGSPAARNRRKRETDLLTVAEVERQHPDEWVLLEIVKNHKHHERILGRLIVHGKDRDVLNGPYRAFRAEHPHAHLYQFYTGDIVPDGVIVVL